jgi:hypothetical protein
MPVRLCHSLWPRVRGYSRSWRWRQLPRMCAWHRVLSDSFHCIHPLSLLVLCISKYPYHCSPSVYHCIDAHNTQQPRVQFIAHVSGICMLRVPRLRSIRVGQGSIPTPRISYIFRTGILPKTRITARSFCFAADRTRMMSPSPPPTESDKPIDYRLPTTVRPTHYDLTFKTDLETLQFWGYGIIESVFPS